MTATGTIAAPAPSVALVGAGEIYSGDVEAPRLDASAVRIEDGVVTATGGDDIASGADLVVDLQGSTLAPGLIDSHCHVVLGDYTPRQQTVGFLRSYVHGGITQVISPGEMHAPGRPRDSVGVRALAVAAQRCWAGNRPGGMKVHGGSLIIEPTLTDAEMQQVADDGVRLAKFGFGAYADPMDGIQQVRGAQAAGITVMCHSGGASIPGSQPITAEHLMALAPDVCGHLNGGPTSLDEAGLGRIVSESEMVVQLVQAGCVRSAIDLVGLTRESDAWSRVIIGSDTPTGTGVMPLGVLKTVAELSSLAAVDGAVAWAWASGAVGRVYDLGTGRIAVGAPADLCLLDAPWGGLANDVTGSLARGDLPGISAVMIDGWVRAAPSRNSPAPLRAVAVPAALRPHEDFPHVS